MKRLCWAFVSLAALAADRDAKPEADPAATKLLADARAARAVWKDFPGFTADLEVNIDGKARKGRVTVDASGDVTLQLPDDSGGRWAKTTLASVVGHRLDDGGTETPCVFEDDNADHPLGRAVRVLSDEFHSSYRIRDRQVIVVNREMKDSRFSITVMENVTNTEGKFLPACFVVNTWDKTGALTNSETHHQTWKRVGAFDLPEGVLVLKATADGKQEARSLKLSNTQLLAGK
jgi:hypothetical protein